MCPPDYLSDQQCEMFSVNFLCDIISIELGEVVYEHRADDILSYHYYFGFDSNFGISGEKSKALLQPIPDFPGVLACHIDFTKGLIGDGHKP